MTRLPEYLAYHVESARIGDIDPSYALLRYVCDRFELNVEQRYWLAFLYAMTYCGASVFYIYQEFPDYENLDSGRLNRWWVAHRQDVVCQTDRRWVRSANMFVPAVESYRKWVGIGTQAERFASVGAIGPTQLTTPEARYDKLYRCVQHLHSFGQFSLFLYLEALHTITPLDVTPTDLDLNVAHSCRNGLCYAYGLDQWLTPSEAPTPAGAADTIRARWLDLRVRLEGTGFATTVWNIETTLCAYKKFMRGRKRYIGYYLDRQAREIAKMAQNVRHGVDWDVLWQYRTETYPVAYRLEAHYGPYNGYQDGIPKRWVADAHARTATAIGLDTGPAVSHQHVLFGA